MAWIESSALFRKDSVALSFGVGFSDPKKTYMKHGHNSVPVLYYLQLRVDQCVDLAYMNGYCLFNIA